MSISSPACICCLAQIFVPIFVPNICRNVTINHRNLLFFMMYTYYVTGVGYCLKQRSQEHNLIATHSYGSSTWEGL